MRQRKHHSPEMKLKVVLEALKEELTVGEIAAKYEVHPNMISRCKQEFLEKGSDVFKRGKSDAERELKDEQAHTARLERKVDQLTCEAGCSKMPTRSDCSSVCESSTRPENHRTSKARPCPCEGTPSRLNILRRTSPAPGRTPCPPISGSQPSRSRAANSSPDPASISAACSGHWQSCEPSNAGSVSRRMPMSSPSRNQGLRRPWRASAPFPLPGCGKRTCQLSVRGVTEPTLYRHKLLPAILRRADDHQQAELVVHPHVAVDPVRPPVDVLSLRQVALAPRRVFVQPLLRRQQRTVEVDAPLPLRSRVLGTRTSMSPMSVWIVRLGK